MDTKYKVFWYSIAFYLLFGFTYLFKAQQYPIRLIPVMLPPYSLKLGEYATSTDNKLQLQVLMTDLQQPSHQVAIKFFLEGGTTNTPIASSAPFIQGYNPFTLFPGQQITLSNVDLRSLFALDNLSGIDPLSYSKALPDGVYSFCFQAYDWFTKNNLSQKACAIAFFNQYEPPFLTLPQNGERIPALSPYDNGAAAMIFQWQPRQIAPNTRYIFTLKELWDLERDPISGFLAAPPFWQEEVFSPTLFYGLDKAQLIPGKRYAWQVQAKSGNPVYSASPTEDNGTYKNNGLSEIFYFDYTENCKTPSLLTAQNAGRGKVKIQWMLNGASAGDYNIQYRKRGTTGEWITAKSYQSPYFITGLEDLTEYEYRVGSVCGNLQNFNSDAYNTNAGNAYAYSAIQYFTTDSKDKSNENFQCGIMPAIDISNKTIYQGALGVNDVIMAGDFPVTITRADGIGNYSGEGYIIVPYLGDTKLKVSFNNIQINTDKKLIAGTIETTYDPSEKAVIDINGFEDLLKDLGAIFIKENPTKEDEDKYKDYKNQLDFYFNNVDDLEMSDEDKKQFEELKTNLFYASIENMSSSEKEKAIEATQKAQKLFEKYKDEFNYLNASKKLMDDFEKLNPDYAKIEAANSVLIFVNGHFSSLLPGPSEGGKKYWEYFDIKPQGHVTDFLEYFKFNPQETAVLYVSGSSIIGFDKDFKNRYKLGQKFINQIIKSHKKLSSKKFAIVAHSEGVAYAAGLIQNLTNAQIKIQEAIYLSGDECAEDGAQTNAYVPTYQLEYMYFDKNLISGSCEAKYDWVIGTSLRYKTYNGLKGVTKFGIAKRNDLGWQTVHGSTASSDVIEFLKTLKKSKSVQNLNGKGEVFYEQTPKSNRNFWKINNIFIDSNHPQFNHTNNQLDNSLPCEN